MAVIQVESVAITKSRLAKGFNGDNLNLNGKVITAEEADAGFKAAGSVKPPYVAVMVSGNQKGFAAGAAAAFNDYVKDINLNKHNAESVINRFFDDMDAVVEKCSIDGARLSIGVVCAYEDCVVAAKTGNCHLLRFSEGELFEIALSDDDGGRGFQFVDVISHGDMFALIGEEASADLDYDGIVTTFDQGVDLKLMIRDMFKLLATGARGKDCSIILMRLNCDAERTYAAIPMAEPMADEEFDEARTESPEDFDIQPPIDADELFETNDYVSDAEMPENGKKPSAKKKILGFIPIAILVILIAVAAALYLATRPQENPDDSEPISDIIVSAEEEDSTGDFNGSHGMQTVEDTEYGGDAGSLDDEDDDEQVSPVTTTRASEPEAEPEPEPDPEPEPTPETTTQNQETTTQGNETTTQAPEPEPEPEPDAPAEEPVVDEPEAI